LFEIGSPFITISGIVNYSRHAQLNIDNLVELDPPSKTTP